MKRELHIYIGNLVGYKTRTGPDQITQFGAVWSRASLELR